MASNLDNGMDRLHCWLRDACVHYNRTKACAAVLTGVTYVAVDAVGRCTRRHPHRITTSRRWVTGIGGMLLVLLLLLLLLWMIVCISTHHLSGLRRVEIHVDGGGLEIRRSTRERTGTAVSSERDVLRRSDAVLNIERYGKLDWIIVGLPR
jgi:hypothetical protein